MRRRLERPLNWTLVLLLEISLISPLMALYPQSLASAVHTFDIIGRGAYLYRKDGTVTVICHPVDEEFFSWMMNTNGSAAQQDHSRSLYKDRFVVANGSYPVFVMNVTNNTDRTIIFGPSDITINEMKVSILELRNERFEIAETIIVPGNSETKVFIYTDETTVKTRSELEKLIVNFRQFSFDFRNNPAWDFLKNDVVIYLKY
ncbi:hypothetical protein [Mesotoga sp. H07.pep.5.3]|uniref:hypothetical protein n=1 Tax=Mesotoga sp. H07.pep.5.3 TaxID=1421003 RepID=UPI00117F7486|nr:hypothetical protein [Mesotoga sp. H07.pep.5.3]